MPPSSQTRFRILPSPQDVLLCPFTVHLTPPCSPKLSYSLLLWVSLFWTLHVSGIIKYVVFRVWLLLLSVMFVRFSHPCCITGPFLLIVGWNFILWITFHLFISSVYEYLDCFQFWLLWIMLPFWIMLQVLVWTYVFIFLGWIPRSKIAG